MDQTAIPTGDASGYAAPFEETLTTEVSPGRAFYSKRLPLTTELANGTIPNQLLDFVLFEDFDGSEIEIDPKTGKEKPKSIGKIAREQKERWENYLRICTRSLVFPRLVLGRAPNLKAGEIGPEHLSYAEARVIAFKAIKEALPAAGTAPFPADGTDSDGTGEPVPAGDAVPHDAE